MANLKHAIKQGIVALKAKNIQPVMQTVGDESLLKGKTALVVGGTGGIGRAVAKAFLKNGANVVIAGTRRAKVDKVAVELGEKCAGVVVNLAEPETFSRVVDEAVAFYGPIDILVNSAGVHTEDVSMGGFLDFTVEEYDRILDINLRGVYFMVQSVAQRMISDKVSNGHILIVSSSAGNEPAWSPYRVSKWGLKGITEGMASALVPHGIDSSSWHRGGRQHLRRGQRAWQVRYARGDRRVRRDACQPHGRHGRWRHVVRFRWPRCL